MTRSAQLARCDREIAEAFTQQEIKPAWLVTLGIEDWEAERRLLLQGEHDDCWSSADAAAGLEAHQAAAA